MKKIFLLLLVFSIAPIYATNATESSLVGLSLTGVAAIGSFILYRIYSDQTTYTNNIPQPHAIVSNETNTNKNEKLDDPITPSNNTPDNPHTFDPQSINNSLERYNNNIKNILDQKTQNQEPVDQPKNEPKEKPNLQEIITKPKIKPNNIMPSKYPTEPELDVLYGN